MILLVARTWPGKWALPAFGKGRLNVYTRHFIKRLEVKLTFPTNYEPELWQTGVGWGRDESESAAHNLHDRVCRHLTFRPMKNEATLIVDEPLAGYSYKILWNPLDHQRFLEARQGDLRE